ncbi:hypothetical protein [Vreelandella venusta]|uniref:hypothetical protein n=1 Tax=Vreelandella venusta TaxID=44935 RepID=UPI003AA839A9
MPFFFLHIPKTAGTSFRLGAEAYFSKERIVYDYGANSKTTSPLVKESLHVDQPDFWQFKKAFLANNPAMICGHVPVARFVSLIGVERTITFLREPLQRIASEYGHFVRNMDYKGSFKEFYSSPAMINRQRRGLNGVNPEAVGFLGLTERYTESLEILNDSFATDIAERKDNLGNRIPLAEHKLDQDDIDELTRLNKRDIMLYKHACALFDARYAMFKLNQPWAHARLVEANTKRISGWAWWANGSDEPVDIELWVKGEHTTTLRAVEMRKELCRLLPPRGGYVGFHLPVKLLPGDTVQCRVAATGQWFPLKPQRVTEPAS